MERSVFLGGQSRPIPRGGPSVPAVLGSPTRAHTAWETATKFCVVIELDERKILRGRPRPLPTAQAKIFVTRDLFAVANLLVSIWRMAFDKYASHAPNRPESGVPTFPILFPWHLCCFDVYHLCISNSTPTPYISFMLISTLDCRATGDYVCAVYNAIYRLRGSILLWILWSIL